MNNSTKKFIIALFIAMLSLACINNQAKKDDSSSDKPLPNEMTEKWKLQQRIALDNAIPLAINKILISDSEEIIDYPSSLTFSDSDNEEIYVSDNMGKAIFKVSSNGAIPLIKSFEAEKNTEKFLQYPTTIKVAQDNIFVADNDGIKIFSKNGEFQKTIKTFYAINDFARDAKGNYFINPNFLDINQDYPLIVKLDENGMRMNEIGKISSPEFNGLESKIQIVTSDDFVIVAYKHLPLVEIYDGKSGSLIRKIEVKASIFEELNKLKENKEFSNPKNGIYVLPRYIAGLKILKDKMFLLLHLPFPEIVELDFQGNEINRFRAENMRKQNYFGFDVRLVGNAYQFLVGAIELSHKPTVIEFNQEN